MSEPLRGIQPTIPQRLRAERDALCDAVHDGFHRADCERKGTQQCVDDIRWLHRLVKERSQERDEARALVLELFRRDCAVNDSYLRSVEGKPWRYDHMCSATYEDAQEQLIAWGFVKREECVRP